MKYKKDDILYFKPFYDVDKKYIYICQIVKLCDDGRYLVIVHDYYSPCHYYKSLINEDDLEFFENSFLKDVVKKEKLFYNIGMEQVLKLSYLDIYNI